MLLVIVGVVGCSGNDSGNSATGGAVINEAVSDIEESEVIKIPLDSITDEVKKFNYEANGVTIRYFAVIGSDEKVRTAFDACDVCGGYGYTQQGNDIACKKCGKVFRIDGLGTKNKGYGCWPSYLSHTVDNENIIINKKELEAGAFRFA